MQSTDVAAQIEVALVNNIDDIQMLQGVAIAVPVGGSVCACLDAHMS